MVHPALAHRCQSAIRCRVRPRLCGDAPRVRRASPPRPRRPGQSHLNHKVKLISRLEKRSGIDQVRQSIDFIPLVKLDAITLPVVVSSAETHRSGRALVHGALRAALSRRGPLRGRTPAPRRRIRAEVPASVGARVRRGRRARGTRWRRRVPRARFVHRQQSALERLMVEAAYGVLDVIVTSHKIRMVRPSRVFILHRTRPPRA